MVADRNKQAEKCKTSGKIPITEDEVEDEGEDLDAVEGEDEAEDED